MQKTKKYKIQKNNFLAHSDIAPLRKTDPGKISLEKLSRFNIGRIFNKF